jgi:hypothetical protein
MSNSIDNSFIKDYESDVHAVFQRQGGFLRQTVRTKDGVVGLSTTFQKVGKGTASTKARHGVVTPMNQSHTPIECTLYDFYAGDWVDKLDEAKTNIDERMAIADGGAWALGRKVDDQIITELDATTSSTVSWVLTSAATVRNSMIEMLEALDNADVPDDGGRYVLLTPRAWSQAETVEAFSSMDYVKPGDMTFAQGNRTMGRWKFWRGAFWGHHTGLPGKGTATAKVFAWHKNAIGYGTGKHAGNVAANAPVSADITWHGDRAAHFVNHMMSGGACLIDDTGVIEGNLDDTASIVTS